MSNPESFVGIDVAKAWLDVAWLTGQTLRIDYTPEAMAGLLEQLRLRPPTLVAPISRGGSTCSWSSAARVLEVVDSDGLS